MAGCRLAGLGLAEKKQEVGQSGGVVLSQGEKQAQMAQVCGQSPSSLLCWSLAQCTWRTTFPELPEGASGGVGGSTRGEHSLGFLAKAPLILDQDIWEKMILDHLN